MRAVWPGGDLPRRNRARPKLGARPARLALGGLPGRLGQLGLVHVGATLDARLLGVVVERLLGLVGVDAAVALPGPVARGAAALRRLRIGRALLVLELPVVALLLGDVLDGGVGGPVRALLAVVLLLCAVEGLGVGALDLLGRARDRAGEVFLLGRHGIRLPAARRRDAPRRLLQCRRRVGREPADELARGNLRGERVRLARPQVEAVGVALLARRGAQWRGQVVHLGVARRRRLGVVAQEAVDDAPGGAPGERARERGRRG